MQIWLYSLGSVLVVSLMSFVGALTLYVKTEKLNKLLTYLISLSAGTLLGDAFFHLLPEVVNENNFGVQISVYVLLGIAISFILEKVIHWRHCHHPTTEDHPHPFALMNLFADGVHNFIDGLIIGASFLISTQVGIATTIAVILHEIPQEIGDFGVLIHGGFSKGKALFVNFLTAVSAVAGTIIALLIGNYVEGLSTFLVPFAAGMFIYIACADLIPELHKEEKASKSFLQLASFILGIGLMAGLLLLEI